MFYRLLCAAICVPPCWSGIDLAIGRLFGQGNGMFGLSHLLERFIMWLADGDVMVAAFILTLWFAVAIALMFMNLFVSSLSNKI